MVDWSYGSWGPAAIDAAHLRWNLALDHGPEGADAVLSLIESFEHHPYWDVVDLLDVVGEPGLELEPIERDRLHAYLESLLRRSESGRRSGQPSSASSCPASDSNRPSESGGDQLGAEGRPSLPGAGTEMADAGCQHRVKVRQSMPRRVRVR